MAIYVLDQVISAQIFSMGSMCFMFFASWISIGSVNVKFPGHPQGLNVSMGEGSVDDFWGSTGETRPQHPTAVDFGVGMAMKGKSFTGNHGFCHQISSFPVRISLSFNL